MEWFSEKRNHSETFPIKVDTSPDKKPYALNITEFERVQNYQQSIYHQQGSQKNIMVIMIIISDESQQKMLFFSILENNSMLYLKHMKLMSHTV